MGKSKGRRRSVKKLMIVIEARSKSDGSDVGIKARGKTIKKIFVEGGDDWNDVSGAVHQLISVVGLSKHGRDVTITTKP